MDEKFITLGQYETAFPSKVKPEVLAYVTGGSASELSLRRNRAALDRIVVEQRIGMDVRAIDLSTRFLGMELPAAVHRLSDGRHAPGVAKGRRGDGARRHGRRPAGRGQQRRAASRSASRSPAVR